MERAFHSGDGAASGPGGERSLTALGRTSAPRVHKARTLQRGKRPCGVLAPEGKGEDGEGRSRRLRGRKARRDQDPSEAGVTISGRPLKSSIPGANQGGGGQGPCADGKGPSRGGGRGSRPRRPDLPEARRIGTKIPAPSRVRALRASPEKLRLPDGSGVCQSGRASDVCSQNRPVRGRSSAGDT